MSFILSILASCSVGLRSRVGRHPSPLYDVSHSSDILAILYASSRSYKLTPESELTVPNPIDTSLKAVSPSLLTLLPKVSYLWKYPTIFYGLYHTRVRLPG